MAKYSKKKKPQQKQTIPDSILNHPDLSEDQKKFFIDFYQSCQSIATMYDVFRSCFDPKMREDVKVELFKIVIGTVGKDSKD